MNRIHQWLCGSAVWVRHAERTLVPWVMDSVDLGTEVLEIGPGYGATTRILVGLVPQLTALEIDADLAHRLTTTVQDVRVVQGDGATMPFPDDAYSGAVCLTMLHHVPSPQLQDMLFAEVHRVLRPGGLFVGSDSRASLGFRLIHLFDTMVIVEPDTLAGRLTAAGFDQVLVDKVRGAFRFRAHKPWFPLP